VTKITWQQIESVYDLNILIFEYHTFQV